MSQPEQPPKYFLDRSLGRKAVPEALRADDWDVITLAEHYGMPAEAPSHPEPAIRRHHRPAIRDGSCIRGATSSCMVHD